MEEITAEYLKNNGYILIAVGDNGIGTPPKNRNRYEKWEHKTQWQTYHLFYDRLRHSYNFNFGYNHIEDIKTIEELNLAKKVCKILEE